MAKKSLEEIKSKLNEEEIYELRQKLYYGGYKGLLNIPSVPGQTFTDKEEGIIGTAISNMLTEQFDNPCLVTPALIKLAKKLTKGIKLSDLKEYGVLSFKEAKIQDIKAAIRDHQDRISALEMKLKELEG